MPFRFRRRVRILPGLSLNFSKYGLSSLSIGRRGATVNVPLAREGGTRTTVGLPGTGLSYTAEASRPSTSQRRNQQRTGNTKAIPSTEELVELLYDAFDGPDGAGDALWHQHGGLVAMLLQRDDTSSRLREQLALITSLERAELHLRRGRTPADTFARMKAIAAAAQAALDRGKEIGIAAP